MREIRPSASDQEVEDDAFFGVGDVMGTIISMGGDLPGPQQDIQIEHVAEQLEQAEQAVR